MSKIAKKPKTNARGGMKESEPSFTVGGITKSGRHYGNQCGANT